MAFRQREYASVWTRFGALILDGLIVVVFYIPFYVLLARSDPYGSPFDGNPTAVTLYKSHRCPAIYNSLYK